MTTKHDYSRYALIILLLILAYFSFLVIKDFLSYLLFSAVAVMITYPVYRWLAKKLGKPRLASILMVLGIILLIVLPTIYIGFVLVQQAPSAYENVVSSINIEPVQNTISSFIGPDIDVNDWLRETVTNFRRYILNAMPGFLTSATQVILGLAIMFFVMYYLFFQANNIVTQLKKTTPLNATHRDKLFKEIDYVIHGIIEGQVILGLLQGILGGLLFWALGIPNAMFWGFVMAVISIIPVLGSVIVWLPAAIILLVTGSIIKGIILIVIGTVIISQVDNFLRPYIVSRYAEVHPALVFVGVLGGLSAFGLIGFIVGPLILALFVAVLKFYRGEVTA